MCKATYLWVLGIKRWTYLRTIIQSTIASLIKTSIIFCLCNWSQSPNLFLFFIHLQHLFLTPLHPFTTFHQNDGPTTDYFSLILINWWFFIDLRIVTTFLNMDNRSCVVRPFPKHSHSKFFTLDTLISLNCSLFLTIRLYNAKYYYHTWLLNKAFYQIFFSLSFSFQVLLYFLIVYVTHIYWVLTICNLLDPVLGTQ